MARESHLHTSSLSERLRLPGTPVVTDKGGGAVEVTEAPGPVVWAAISPIKGREHLLNRQVVGEAPYSVTVRRPLPSGSVLTSDSVCTWEHADGALQMHLQGPPQMTKDRMYYTFFASVKQ